MAARLAKFQLNVLQVSGVWIRRCGTAMNKVDDAFIVV
jgi:hypothetical protein